MIPIQGTFTLTAFGFAIEVHADIHRHAEEMRPANWDAQEDGLGRSESHFIYEVIY